MKEYKVTYDEIKVAFQESDTVEFRARPFNDIRYRSICFKGFSFSLPLIQVFSVIEITPQMLRPVFSPQTKWVKRTFPFNLSWFGLNNKYHKMVDDELPLCIDTYKQLGPFPLDKERFVKLAQVLSKKIKVIGEKGIGDSYYLFTVDSSGEITDS